jgi:integrase
MAVKVRPYRRGGWEVDIRLELPDGREIRKRTKAPVSARSAALRWGQGKERELLLAEPVVPVAEAPDLASFVPQFLERHARANRQKPSAVATQETILERHLLPRFGSKKLDAITTEDIQHLKSELHGMTPKTVNNILSVLNVVLKVAVEWQVIRERPCAIRLLKTSRTDATFFDFAEYVRLIAAARQVDRRAYLAVLLGGDAGLRSGEMLALEWGDLDLERQQLLVQRSDWEGQVTLPKGGRPRRLPLTQRLLNALRGPRERRGVRILTQDDGKPLTRKMLQSLVWRSARRAKLDREGVHVLRHTFCSHLAMRGAPARAIQELAGHKDLSTTQRYMHLSPSAVDAAIRLLESSPDRPSFGDILETEHFAKVK